MVPSSCPPCQGSLESDPMAMAREIVEAACSNNNITVMHGQSPRSHVFFSFQNLLAATAAVDYREKIPRNIFSIHHETFFFIALRIYVLTGPYIVYSLGLASYPTRRLKF